MKKDIAIVFILSLVLITCSEDNTIPENNLDVNDESIFELKGGYYQFEAPFYKVFLTENALDSNISSYGDAYININFLSPEGDSLVPGTYEFAEVDEADDFNFQAILNLYGYSGAYFESDTGSVVDVSFDGSKYLFEFDLNYSVEKEITGKYSGNLEELSDEAKALFL